MFEQQLEIGSIPDSVDFLDMSEASELCPLGTGVIPQSVKDLFLPPGYLGPAHIPHGVERLEIGVIESCFTDQFQLPTSIKYLKLEQVEEGEEILPGIIPASVTHLDLDQPFAVGSIPTSVTNLTINKQPKPLEVGSIPNLVKRLTFGRSFDHPIPFRLIPNSVTHLTFGSAITEAFEPGCLPDSIRHFEILMHDNQSLRPGVIPDSVTHLKIGQQLEISMLNVMLRRLASGVRYPIMLHTIPNSVTHLEFKPSYTSTILTHSIPQSVTHLVFGDGFKQPVEHNLIPNSVVDLSFDDNFDSPIEAGAIPNSVKRITFGSRHSTFTRRLAPGALPASIKTVKFAQSTMPQTDLSGIPETARIKLLQKETKQIIFSFIHSKMDPKWRE